MRRAGAMCVGVALSAGCWLAVLPVVIQAGVAAAQGLPSPSPAPGPCEQPGAIGALVDRPGLGRPTAQNGSPCAVPRGQALLEFGYRAQATHGNAGTSTLAVYPLALLRLGLGERTELDLQPPSAAVRSGANLGGPFVPASGTQDIGFGAKRMLDDRAGFQDSLGFFMTVPSGAPQGSAGFSGGSPTYALGYTAAFPLGSTLGVSVTQNFGIVAAPLPSAGGTRFFSYQPSLTVGYAFAPNTTLLLSDQITAPLGPAGGTGNRGLVALQRVLSQRIAIDLEYELNALPATPAASQHALGAGAAFAL